MASAVDADKHTHTHTHSQAGEQAEPNSPVDRPLVGALLLLPELVQQRLPRHLLQLELVARHVRPRRRRGRRRERKRRALEEHRGPPAAATAGRALPNVEGGAVADGVRRGRGVLVAARGR